MEEDDIILIVDSDIKLTKQSFLTPIQGLLLEYNVYKRFGETKLYYRLDKANNAVGQQRHIHVFKDKDGRIQVFAINFDGTPHDGSKYQLTPKIQDALIKLGIPVPPSGILEWEIVEGGKQLLLD